MSGVLAAFDSEQGLRTALARLRSARVGRLETYTPVALEEGPSILPSLVLLAGVLGAVGSFCLQSYANMMAYPVEIGGRPEFSWPAFVPVAFENGVLAAVVVGFVGYFVAARLTRLYEPVDECEAMRRAMRDLWCVAIRTDDPAQARTLLLSLSPLHVEDIPT
jgi:uncharacterized membrane protein YeaQ/YmgE (transglycosylase-associated protein family)